MITIRFANTTHDPLEDIIYSPDQHQNPNGSIWAVSLKVFVRNAVPQALKKRRIRLIAGGQALADWDVVANTSVGITGHGKQSSQPGVDEAGDAPVAGIFVLCAIGSAEDEESDEQIEREANLADHLEKPAINIMAETTFQTSRPFPLLHNTTRALLGFDRLLSQGFTEPDISQMRELYRHSLSYRFTPSQMPHGTALLALEDEWLDANGTHSASNTDDPLSGLDTFIKGFLTGFFCPFIFVILWSDAEAMTPETKYYVGAGAAVNLGFALLRQITVKIAGT